MGLKEGGLRGSLRSTSSVLPAFFDVTITNTNSPVQEGDILAVDYSADNTGDAQDTQDIRLEIDSVQEDVDPGVLLGGGASATGTLEWDTTDEAEAEYTATVLSDDDSDSVTVEIGSAIPDSGLLHEWRISDDSDPIVDSEGDEDLTVNGGSFDDTTQSWIDGWAYDADGVDDYAESGSIIDPGSAYSICAWIYPRAADDGVYVVNGFGAEHKGRIRIREDSGNWSFSINNGGFTNVQGETANLDELTLITGRVDGDDMSIVENTTETGSLTDSNISDAVVAEEFRIGGDPTEGDFGDGILDWVLLYDKWLTDDEIQEIYDAHPST